MSIHSLGQTHAEPASSCSAVNLHTSAENMNYRLVFGLEGRDKTAQLCTAKPPWQL